MSVLSERSPKRQAARVALLGVVATVLSFFIFRGASAPDVVEPLDAVPRESFLVATLDVAELRRSPLYEALFGRSGTTPSRALSFGDLEEACGFDPFTRVGTLALSVPEQEGERDYGVVARVQVSRDELLACKARLEARRGGGAQGGDGAGTTVKDRGPFVVVEGVRTGSGGTGSLAYGKGNLLVVSRGAWFDAILATANRERPSVRRSEIHAALRTALTSREGWRAPTLVVTSVLPRSLRDRIRGDMGAEVEPTDASQKAMAGVLGVAAVGLALRAGPSGGNVDAQLELTCDTPDACDAVEKLIQKKRLDWSKDVALRMVGLGAVIDSIATRLDGQSLRVTASVNADALAATIERIMKLRAR